MVSSQKDANDLSSTLMDLACNQRYDLQTKHESAHEL